MNRSRLLTLACLVVVGCGKSNDKPTAEVPSTQTPETKLDDVAVERAKLSAADRELVDAQEWCVISTDERLGSMGPPLKLDIQGQSVFICCKGCKRKAEAEPDRTLAKLKELQEKAKAKREGKS